MNLLQAIGQGKVKPGDKINFPATKDTLAYTITIDENGGLLTGKVLLSIDYTFKRTDFEIIHPAPEVLTAEEWVKENINKYWGASMTFLTEEKFGADAFRSGEQNDRERTQPLIDAVKKYIDGEGSEWHRSGIVEALENIKPLEQK